MTTGEMLRMLDDVPNHTYYRMDFDNLMGMQCVAICCACDCFMDTDGRTYQVRMHTPLGTGSLSTTDAYEVALWLGSRGVMHWQNQWQKVSQMEHDLADVIYGKERGSTG